VTQARLALFALAALLLSGCGGGGGGSGGFTVRAQQSSVTFDYAQGSEPAAQIVTATWTGDPPQPLYVAAILQGTGLSATIPIAITQTNATATLRPSPGLEAGQYSGQVQLMACTDSACNQRVGGTPITISYSINVRAPMFSGPAIIGLRHTRWSGVQPAGVALNVNASAGSWTATASQPWISLSQASGSGAAKVVVSFNPDALGGIGRYAGTVTLAGAGGSQTSNVFIDVTAPGISVRPVTFTGVNGATLAPQSAAVNVIFDGAGIGLAMSATTTTPWLTIDSASPRANNVTPGTIVLSANPAVGPLASGRHTGSVSVKLGPPEDFTTVNFDVTLELAKPTLTFAPASVTLGGTHGRSMNAVPFTMSLNTGPRAYTWSAGASPGWAALNVTGGSVDVTPRSLQITPRSSQATPGTSTTTLRFSTQVNGDLIAGDLPVSFNLDTHRLIASENGVALVDVPASSWDRLTHTVTVKDNFGIDTQWTASSDQAWLQVTASGGNGDDLVLTADTAGLGIDQLYTATVTIATTDATVAEPERIRVGLWFGSSTPPASRQLSGVGSRLQAVAGDPIRPYVYVLERELAAVKVFNAYTGQQLPSLPLLPLSPIAFYSNAVVSSDGGTLYAWDTFEHRFIPVDLNSGAVGTPIQSQVDYSASFEQFKYVRPNGVGILLHSQGEAIRAGTGTVVGIGFAGRFGASGNSEYVFSNGSQRIDFTSAQGGIFTKEQAVGAIDGFGFNAQESNFDGSRVYAIGSGGVLVGNGLTGASLGTLSTGLYYENTLVTRQGRVLVLAGASVGSGRSLYVFEPNGSQALAPVNVGVTGSFYQSRLSTSGDGNFGFVVSITPATAVHVVPLVP
jgi:hypothetical protein